MIKTCPICKKEFETDDFRRKYCTLECYKKSKNNKNIEKTCPICNKKFKTRHEEQICCSHECAGEMRKIEKIKLICPICKKVFYKKQCEIRNVKGEPCCSLECSRRSRQKYKELDVNCSKDRLHHIWYGMLKRCFNKQENAYKYYGGRGITVCEEWKNNFLIFREWALNNGYADDLTIERIDVNGNYEPSNCTWVTMEEQAKNKQTTLKVYYKGQYIRLKEIANKENVDYKDLWATYKRNQDIEEALRISKLHGENLIATNKSGHRGVYFYKGKWTAYCKHKYIGRFDTFEEAVEARLKKEDEYNKRTE